jgi:hypothetical protein
MLVVLGTLLQLVTVVILRAVTLWSYILEAFGSNLSQDTGYSDVHGFSHFLQENIRVVPQVGKIDN